MKLNSRLKNLSPYYTEILCDNIIRCHSNESDKAILSLDLLTKNAFDDLNLYPEKVYDSLIGIASKFYNIDQSYMVTVNGSDEGLDLIIRAFCNPLDKMIVLNPTFSMYSQYADLHGLEILKFDLNKKDFSINIDAFIQFCQIHKPKLIIIPNPLAPTGGITSNNDIMRIVKTLPESFIVIDEAYIEFSSQSSMISSIMEHENIIITRTLSKFFGLAGIRLGFLFSHYKDEIFKVKSPYNINSITCKIGINLFENLSNDIMLNRRVENNKNIALLYSFLKNFDDIDEIYTSHSNYLFVKLTSESRGFAEKILMKYNIKIKSFDGEFSSYCRVSCGMIERLQL